jgi:uncharacterized protein (DUF2062 family)
MADRSRKTPQTPRRWLTGLDVVEAFTYFPEVFVVIALLVGLTITGGIFFAVTSGWWPVIFTTLAGAMFIAAMVVLLYRLGQRQLQRQRRRRRQSTR